LFGHFKFVMGKINWSKEVHLEQKSIQSHNLK
jgi:hypothetical protein